MKPLQFLFTFFILLFIASCNETSNMQDKDAVATSESLPIDGVYDMTNGYKKAMDDAFDYFGTDKLKVRFDKGRAYFEKDSWGSWGHNGKYEPGKVFLDQITMVNPYKYRAVFYVPGINSNKRQNVVILLNGSNLTMPVQSGLFNLEYTFIPLE
jgi:hypothetical protein